MPFSFFPFTNALCKYMVKHNGSNGAFDAYIDINVILCKECPNGYIEEAVRTLDRRVNELIASAELERLINS